MTESILALIHKHSVLIGMFGAGLTWGAIRYVSILLPAFSLLAWTGARPQWRSPFQRVQRKAGQFQRESGLSLSTLLIGGILGPLFAIIGISGHSHFYYQVDEYGWVYLFASILIMVFIRETLFYWSHRVIHDRRLFRYIHRAHHLSIHITPLTGYSMQPTEALIDAMLPTAVILLVLPVHPLAFAAFWWIDTVWSVFGHSGIEIFPAGTPRHWLGRWLNTPTAHALHHTEPRYNFGFYLLFWDRVCSTLHPEYERHFDKHASVPAATADLRPAA